MRIVNMSITFIVTLIIDVIVSVQNGCKRNCGKENWFRDIFAVVNHFNFSSIVYFLKFNISQMIWEVVKCITCHLLGVFK